MTKNDNHSRIGGKWRTMTKECCNCESKTKEGDRVVCNFGGVTSYISTKVSRVYSKCTLKLSNNKNL